MQNEIILHIPHASTKLTREFRAITKCISKAEIQEFNCAITDRNVDKLFSYRTFKYVRAKYSRICCDMERFANDADEDMAKYGMGVIYTHTCSQKRFIRPADGYREQVLHKYYYPYHKKLDRIVFSALQKRKKVLLIDCHSFSREIIITKPAGKLPDICIGTDKTFTPQKLTAYSQKYFSSLGYDTAIDTPYCGTMIPNALFHTAVPGFYAIMLEINKCLYADAFRFRKLKKQIFAYLQSLKNCRSAFLCK